MASGQGVTTDGHSIRPAATVVLWRRAPQGGEVLMGQRGTGAVFMPSKFVFPGGALDPGDASSGGALAGLRDPCRQRLTQNLPANAPDPDAIGRAALRELGEETGLSAPEAVPMQFIFRAITPPGRTRRFDTRFFLIAATDLGGDPADFTRASGELSRLHWTGLHEARSLDLPFVTEIVLAEVAGLLAGRDQPGVPFFDNSGSEPVFRRLN